ncbi:hypothetical protein F5148DRAFT_975291 [Russula earlei]|uniref:Uncharacterized protein n=1 Tax=Russula earlei TaxID=71964 RepID=A0ACC0UJR2_9AGAM|nr:hypothetical protein F5148DRAFT_975291 [Russula earlei]
MPLASSGLSSFVARQASRAIHNPPNVTSARSLHTPSFAPRGAPHQPSPLTSRVLHRTRAIFNAFVGHLTTPGTLRAPCAAPRSLQTIATRMPTIENTLSLPVRHALSMRMGSPRLPRPPGIPRNITQVGLGTARNFTTGRPIFQSLADKMHNIPVASRAFLEADFDTRMKGDNALTLKLKRARTKSKKRTYPTCASNKVDFHPAVGAVEAEAEFDEYFTLAQVPDVSTTLLVPLAPTPTARIPLAHTFAYDRHPLVPFLELSALHIDTERHASRVHALFEQLDAAQVWTKGATCETLGGACGIGVLRVRFTGWSAHAVRGILGEAATGWCILEEERVEESKDEEPEDEAAMSLSDVGSALPPDGAGLAELNSNSPIDPAYSFVFPMLDFSASASQLPLRNFAPGAGADSPLSGLAPSASPSDPDMFSDFDYISDGGFGGGTDSPGWIEPPDALNSSRTRSWTGISFSSAFSQRLEEAPFEMY